MNARPFLALLALHVATSSSLAAQDRWDFASRSERTTDAIITRDLAWFDSIRVASATPRAQLYVQLARDAYERNDDGALSARLLNSAVNGASSGTAGGGSSRARRDAGAARVVRPELWQLLDSVHGAGAATAETRAHLLALEEALVRAAEPLLGAPSCAVWEREAERLAGLLRLAPRAAQQSPAPPVVTPAPRLLRALTGLPNRVHFALDRSTLSAESQRVLAALADSIAPFPDVMIVVEGHTDLRATDTYNLRLSARRALAVRRFLVARGIAESRLQSEAKGEGALDVPGTTSLDHARNRRVVLRFRSVDGREVVSVEQFGDLQVERRR